MREASERGGRASASGQTWPQMGRGTPPPVQSRRLGREAPVQSRLLPKVRSWLALGAPLELLSPLSALRALVALAVVLALSGVLLPGWPRGSRELASGLALAALVLGALLVRPRALGKRENALGAVALAALTGALLGTWAGSPAVVLALALVPLVALFAALFLALPVALGAGALVVLGVAVGASLHNGTRSAPEPAVGTALLFAGPYLLGGVLARSASAQGQVDRDTGVPNGYGLATQLASGGTGEPLAVASVALSGIAEVREAFGFEIGTELLRRVVEDLGQIVPKGGRVGRVEGDELVVAWRLRGAPLSADAFEAGAAETASRLVSGIEHGRYEVADVTVRLQAHVGLALGLDGERPFAELVRRSALAARAAARRREPVRVFAPGPGALAPADLRLMEDLRRAIEKPDELRLAFQAQVDARSHQPVAAEVLARWEHPTLGMISPGRFIPLAERSGVIAPLTRRLLDDALGALERLGHLGSTLGLSVNLSPVLLGHSELAAWLEAELGRRDVDPRQLTIEVTESSPIDLGEALRLLGPLHERGVRVSLDDFGTGYTSMANLPGLCLDELKVDQRFVLASPTSASDEAIVASLAELGRRLSLTLVAEGVETETHALAMERLGFDLLQGFHFARPESEAALLARLGLEPGSSRLRGLQAG